MLEITRDFPLLPNAWLGASVEDGHVLYRIDALRQVPSAIRFISFEPLIGSVAAADLTGIHWVIVGGESGPRARPMDPTWVDEIEAMCRAAAIAFFFKQWGGKNKKKAGRLLKGKTVSSFCSSRIAPTRRTIAFSLGKMPTTSARRLISPLRRSIGLVECSFVRCCGGNVM